MAFSSVNGAHFKLSQIFVFMIVFCSILPPSHQDLFKKVLEQELGEELSSTSIDKRSQKTKNVYDASGIKQSPLCGLNSLSDPNGRRRRENEKEGPYDWPWMVAILDKNGYGQFCGGSLLNHQYVLTAAHCFAEPGKKKEGTDVIIRLGEVDLNSADDTKNRDYNVRKVEIHDNWDPVNKANDIALIKLERGVQYNQFIRPLCLPSIEVKPNETMIVAGWGATESMGNHSPFLLDVDVPVVSHTDCTDSIAHSNAISQKGNICAGGVEGKDSCQGDSGGPLVIQDTSGEKRWMIVGIVSWGMDCGSYRPGVYTNVKHYLDWIGKRILDAAI